MQISKITIIFVISMSFSATVFAAWQPLSKTIDDFKNQNDDLTETESPTAPVGDIVENDGFMVIDFELGLSDNDLLDYVNNLIGFLWREDTNTIEATKENVSRLSGLIKKLLRAFNRLKKRFYRELNPNSSLFNKKFYDNVAQAIKDYNLLFAKVEKFKELFIDQAILLEKIRGRIDLFNLYYNMLEDNDFTQKKCRILYNEANAIGELVDMVSSQFDPEDRRETLRGYESVKKLYNSFYDRCAKKGK